MSQKGQEDILDGEWGGDVLGEDVVVAEARGACADVGGEGFGVRNGGPALLACRGQDRHMGTG
jgi:hypothetical protein